MYYEEKVIDGVMNYRTNPNGDWIQMDSKLLTIKYQESEKELNRLKQQIYDLLEGIV